MYIVITGFVVNKNHMFVRYPSSHHPRVPSTVQFHFLESSILAFLFSTKFFSRAFQLAAIIFLKMFNAILYNVMLIIIMKMSVLSYWDSTTHTNNHLNESVIQEEAQSKSSLCSIIMA